MATIPSDLDQLATEASMLTGLDKNVILAQWVSENGWTVPTSNNFGNIRFASDANNALWDGVVGTPNNGEFVKYQTPLDGVKAYATLINTDRNYTVIRASRGKSVSEQLQSIVLSPWDAGHYNGGSTLTDVYNSITHASIAPGGSTGKTGFSWTDPVGSLTTLFWMILGLALILLGIYVMTNPLADLTTAISKINLGSGEHVNA
jgi:hypothetical protein